MPDERITWTALARRYGSTARRRVLFRSLRAVLTELRARGFAGNVTVGGSFVTAKAEPNDIDIVCDCAEMPAELWPRFARGVLADRSRWDGHGIDVNLWRPELPRDVRNYFRCGAEGDKRALCIVSVSGELK